MCGEAVKPGFFIDRTPDNGSPSSATEAQRRQTKTAGWRHISIVLEPLNPDYEPIELTGENDSPVAVIAELIDEIGTDSPLE